MASVIYHPRAEQEVWDAAGWYEEQRAGLGADFLRRLEAATNAVLEHPLRWPTYRGRFRRYKLSKYPYGIVYAVETDHIYVVAVMHLKRRPDYWVRRAPE